MDRDKFLTFALIVFFRLTVSAAAQEPPPAPAPQVRVMEYAGKPIAFPFRCTDDDIQWAGLTCSQNEPCPIYLELSALEASGDRIVAAGNLHSPEVTLYSVLLASEDGGRTWIEPAPRIRGAVLDRIQFLDPQTGWVSGHSNSPLPQDPFLMVTTDGGKTWRQRPVFSDTAEDRLGMVQQFFFTGKDEGSLVIDRGQGSADDRWELYESPDGGNSWSIRQSSSKPISLKQAFVGGAPWRLRADAATKAFHVERLGQRWNTVAAFAVGAGACRPEP